MAKTKKSRKNSKLARGIPYARGFTPPTDAECMNAIGAELHKAEFKHLRISSKFFRPIPQPTSVDDWLAQYKDEGQTFEQYSEENPWLSSRKVKYWKQTFVKQGSNLPERYPSGKIYIVCVGDFSKERLKLADLVAYTQIFFGLPVEELSPICIEEKEGRVCWINNQDGAGASKEHRLQSRSDPHSGKVQLCVDGLLKRLQVVMPDDALCLLGLTMFDLYADKSDLFVAGMAAGNRRVGVFSLFRYSPNITFSPEHWYDITEVQKLPEDECRRLLLLRGCRLLVHEICHLFGVGHCIYFACCMNGSGHLEEDFAQPMQLCPVDLHKLEVICGFNVITRYKKLLDFFVKHQMQEDVNWVSRRMKFISG